MIQYPKFIDLLKAHDVVSEETLRRLLERFNGNPYDILLHLVAKYPPKNALLGKLWGDSIGKAYVDLRISLLDNRILQRLPKSFALKNRIILMYQFGSAITAAMSDPTDRLVVEEAERLCGCPISSVFALPDNIQETIDVEYASEASLSELSNNILKELTLINDLRELTREELERISGNQAMVEFADGIFIRAIREGASDIHIEPTDENILIRFRIDGVLQEKLTVEKAMLLPLISRIKIIAKLDITEKRKPQDGRITFKLADKPVEFRISTIPTINGEKIALRLLGQVLSRDIPDLGDLSFSRSNLESMLKILELPHGIFFATGPTGTGKTTTLFSMLKHLNKPGINITTIEDPVEYRLRGCNQVQINPSIEFDFPSALRSFLRQDPDVILVGEIRDMETAEIACRAALTGHLVLATLHANNAIQAVTRLIDIGVKPFIVAPSIVGVISQRLVRRICLHCRERYVASSEEIGRMISHEATEVFLYHGQGCRHCSDTGYSGRIAIQEVMIVNNDIRTLIMQNVPLYEIEQYARKTGFMTMRYDGIKKALRGLTTLEEVMRVTVAEDERVGMHPVS